jgi:hypothetical protein
MVRSCVAVRVTAEPARSSHPSIRSNTNFGSIAAPPNAPRSKRQPLLDIAADLAGWNCGLVDEKAKPIVEFEKTEPPMKYY